MSGTVGEYRARLEDGDKFLFGAFFTILRGLAYAKHLRMSLVFLRPSAPIFVKVEGRGETGLSAGDIRRRAI